MKVIVSVFKNKQCLPFVYLSFCQQLRETLVSVSLPTHMGKKELHTLSWIVKKSVQSLQQTRKGTGLSISFEEQAFVRILL